MEIAWPSRSSGWPTTPCGARCGRRRRGTASEAGQKAAARQAHRDAVASFEQALAALARLPQTSDRQGTGHRPPVGHSEPRSCLSETSRVFRVTSGRRSPSPRPSATRCRQAAIAVSLAHCLWATGTDRARLRGGTACSRARHPALAISVWQRSARFVLGEIHIRSATTSRQSRTSWSTSRWNRSTRPGAGRRTAAWHVSVVSRGCSLRRWPRSVGSRRRLRAAPRPWRSLRRPTTHSASPMPLPGLGSPSCGKATLEQAIPLLERACELSRSLSFHWMSSACSMPLGAAYALSGRSAEAVLVAGGCRMDPAPASNHWTSGRELAPQRSHGRGRRPRPAGARARTRAQERGQEAWALRILGEIAAGREPPDPRHADGHYREALALAGELGMRPLVAHCHLGLGKLYRRTGQRERGAGAPHHRDDDVPRDGHAVLAGAGGSGDEGAGVMQRPLARHPDAGECP